MKKLFAFIKRLTPERLKKYMEGYKASVELFKLFKKLFREGYVEVITNFKYKDEEIGFRTMVQPDADIINFIPDVRKYGSDKAAVSAIMEQYKVHTAKLNHLFAIMGNTQHAGDKFTDVLLFFVNIGPIAYAVADFQAETAGLSATFLSASFIVRKFFKEKLMKFSTGAVFKLVKWWM